MAEQLASGLWRASRVESGKRVIRICETEEEAVAWEKN